jgi:hypothetical protein
MQLDRIAGRAAAIAAICCGLTLGLTTVAIAIPSVRNHLGLAAVAEPTYAVGQRVDLPAAAYASAPYTLILFARSSCSACQKSADVLRELFLRANRSGLALTIVDGTSSRVDDVGFVSDIGGSDAKLVSLDLTRLRLKRVPTLLLVDKTGRVIVTHEGLVQPKDELQFVQGMTAAPGH